MCNSSNNEYLIMRYFIIWSVLFYSWFIKQDAIIFQYNQIFLAVALNFVQIRKSWKIKTWKTLVSSNFDPEHIRKCQFLVKTWTGSFERFLVWFILTFNSPWKRDLNQKSDRTLSLNSLKGRNLWSFGCQKFFELRKKRVELSLSYFQEK